MIPLYLDEDVTERLTEALLDLGLDATSVNRLGHKGLKDPQQLLMAARLQRVFVTYNTRDFVLLHEAWHAWSTAWDAKDAARHHGILLLYPKKGDAVQHLARALHRFAFDHVTVDSRAFAWTRARDWYELHPAPPLP